MTVQDDINKAIDDLMNVVMDASQTYSAEIVDNIYGIRLRVNDILAEYAKNDGTISKYRLRKLLEELDEVEFDIGDEFYDAMDKAIVDVSEKTENNLISVLIATLGVAVLFGGKDKRPKSDDLVEDIRKFVFDFDINGVRLLDRIASVSGFLRDEIQQAIRYGTHHGENVTQLSKRVKDAFDKTAWQFKRIVTTELPLAFRKGILTVGDKTGVIKAVKIIDNRGRHKYHESHECYRLAEQNPYGWGKGVYKTSDTYILAPHPQCSAYYHYILKKEINEGGGA